MALKAKQVLTFYSATKLRIFISIIGILGNPPWGIISVDAQTAIGSLSGFRVDSYNELQTSSDGRVSILSGRYATLRLFLSDGLFAPDTQISFTATPANKGTNCDDLRISNIFNLTSAEADSALVNVMLWAQQGSLDSCGNLTYMMFCLRQKQAGKPSSWIHQGDSPWLQIAAEPYQESLTPIEMVPLWVKCFLIVVFITFSGLFTGLGLGLLSLTRRELKTMRNLGSGREKRYAKIVYPMRKKGNFLLCTITLVNALANIAVTILFYELIGLWSVLASALSIVFIGEILPQTVVSLVGIQLGLKTAWFTNFFMIFTAPLTYPIGKLMDWLLDEEIPSVYNRDRLQELIRASETRAEGAEVRPDQVNRMLDLSNKSVKDIMTKLDDVYMVEYNSVLTIDQLGQIIRAGYTRVPVYDSERWNVVAILHVKDLALVDPADRTTVKTICKFYNRPVNFVFEDTKLNVMLEEFKKGQSHMAFLQRVNSEGLGDPFYETLGMLTLEDVIEEIFQSDYKEDVDGDIVGAEGKELTASLNKVNLALLTLFNAEKKVLSISPQMAQAACQFLSQSVIQFNERLISPRVLNRLIHQNVLVHFNPSDVQSSGNNSGVVRERFLYENGKTCDYFVLILEGHVQIYIGKERLVFDGGPFTFFGVQALTGVRGLDAISEMIDVTRDTVEEKYLPDFTVKAVGSVLYLRISRALYIAALRATALHHEQINGGPVVEDMFVSGPWTSLSPEYDYMSDAVPSYDNRSTDRTRLLGGRNTDGAAPAESGGESIDPPGPPPTRTNGSAVVGEATVIIDPDITKHSNA